jgi:transposase InsO family protein
MNDSNLNTLDSLKAFLDASKNIQFKRQDPSEAYRWIQNTVIKFNYLSLGKFEKGLVKRYIMRMTQYSRAQITRLLSLYQHTGHIEEADYQRHCFATRYHEADLRLLAQTDELHGFPNGCALKCRLHTLAIRDPRYAHIAQISVAHIYKLRRSKRYQRFAKRFEKTKPIQSSIGRRAQPQPNGCPGYVRVDTVHQGDRNGLKGVYHINTVDEVTQYEFVAAAQALTQDILIPILRRLLEAYPFKIIAFHCDNGSEFINQHVVALLNELLVSDLTKSRPRHSNDNAIVESKNGSIIRTWIGYGFIDKQFARDLNVFYFGCFNEYLNYHRPCAFPSIRKLPKGKIKKIYRQEDYATPYDKLKSLPHAKKYLKKGVSFKQLDRQFLCRNCNQHAEIVQHERQKLFNKIFALNNSPTGSLFN